MKSLETIVIDFSGGGVSNEDLKSFSCQNLQVNICIYKDVDHDEIAGSRICMSKDIDLNNMLFSTVHFAFT